MSGDRRFLKVLSVALLAAGLVAIIVATESMAALGVPLWRVFAVCEGGYMVGCGVMALYMVFHWPGAKVAADDEPLEGQAKRAFELEEALHEMVWQFADRGEREGQPVLYTGGLSSLEQAFLALGWVEPHPCTEQLGPMEASAEKRGEAR